MKPLLLFMFVGTLLMAANAPEAAKELGVQSSYAAAVSKAKAEKKLLVMVIVKEHCRWCDKLMNRTLKDPKVLSRLKQDYVTLIVDKDALYPSDFKENFYPSIFYIDAKTGKSVYENVGYVGTKCFLNDLEGAEKIRNDLYHP